MKLYGRHSPHKGCDCPHCYSNGKNIKSKKTARRKARKMIDKDTGEIK